MKNQVEKVKFKKKPKQASYLFNLRHFSCHFVNRYHQIMNIHSKSESMINSRKRV